MKHGLRHNGIPTAFPHEWKPSLPEMKSFQMKKEFSFLKSPMEGAAPKGYFPDLTMK